MGKGRVGSMGCFFPMRLNYGVVELMGLHGNPHENFWMSVHVRLIHGLFFQGSFWE